jgi:hypothetical protein
MTAPTPNPFFREPDAIARRFLDRLVASPPGRAFLLGFMADAEDSDEASVFDSLLARVDDERLHRMVRIHRDDETRHAAMLRECLARTGVVPEPLPDHLRIIARIDRELDGFAERFVAGEYGVMEAYALLHVIEERAVLQFPYIVRALRPVDPESADVVAAVIRDEERHVGYANAIGRAYAPDAETHARTLHRFRAAEHRAFTAHGADFLRCVVDRELLTVGPIERWLWRALALSSGGWRAKIRGVTHEASRSRSRAAVPSPCSASSGPMGSSGSPSASSRSY